MSELKFLLRPEAFCIHRLDPGKQIEFDRLRQLPWYSLTVTSNEISIVAPDDFVLDSTDRQPGWSCFQIAGVLDFGLVGVIRAVANVLADAQVSIFAISTYDTDYVFVKSVDVQAARTALLGAGHTFLTD